LDIVAVVKPVILTMLLLLLLQYQARCILLVA